MRYSYICVFRTHWVPWDHIAGVLAFILAYSFGLFQVVKWLRSIAWSALGLVGWATRLLELAFVEVSYAAGLYFLALAIAIPLTIISRILGALVMAISENSRGK